MVICGWNIHRANEGRRKKKRTKKFLFSAPISKTRLFLPLSPLVPTPTLALSGQKLSFTLLLSSTLLEFFLCVQFFSFSLGTNWPPTFFIRDFQEEICRKNVLFFLQYEFRYLYYITVKLGLHFSLSCSPGPAGGHVHGLGVPLVQPVFDGRPLHAHHLHPRRGLHPLQDEPRGRTALPHRWVSTPRRDTCSLSGGKCMLVSCFVFQ